MAICGQIVDKYGLAGAVVASYGPYGAGQEGILGIEAKPFMVLEVKQIAKDWGIEKPESGSMRLRTAPPLAIAPFDAAQAKQHQQAWGEYLGVPVEITNSIGMKFMLIPPGEFMMGSSQTEVANLLKDAAGEWYYDIVRELIQSESPQHTVRITKPFYVAIHEVTVGKFTAFVEATGYKTEAETDGKGGSTSFPWQQRPDLNWKNMGSEQSDQHPVVNVTWNDAVAFCKWLSEKEGSKYRLPSEAQWEYACRAGSATRWSFGDNKADLDRYAWYEPNRGGGRLSKPVGQKSANGLGLFDMCGNVWEWCSDRYSPDYYGDSPADDPIGPSRGNWRVCRGGAFNEGTSSVRCASRYKGEPTVRNFNIGFRPVRTCP
jgi:formylglycine-generating enzyme required for sulfatase activity